MNTQNTLITLEGQLNRKITEFRKFMPFCIVSVHQKFNDET